MKFLRAHTGKHRGKTFTLNKRLLIGRGSASDVIVASEGVSRRHALIMVRDDGLVILRDLASRNGTQLAGRLVRQVFLNNGDRFVIGDSEFEFRVQDENALTQAPLPRSTFSGLSDKTTIDHLGHRDRKMALIRRAKELANKKKV